MCFQSLEALCNPIVNKPKPKVEPPKDTKPAEEAAQPAANEAGSEQAAPAGDASQATPQPTNMDCDLD